MFSVIIPTMYKSEKLFSMLPIYEQSEHVGEIIIINNAEQPESLEKYQKVKELGNFRNIYVNPAWNLGASECENEILLVNDDLLILNFDEICELIEKSDFDIIGMSLRKDQNLRITEVQGQFPNNSYGTFMYIRKYQYLPDNLKIWYGDKILFDCAKKRGIIRGAKILTDKSETIDSDANYFRNQIGGNDIVTYDNITRRKEMNIIIRTSCRPVYFSKCIDSIKITGINVKLHIISDCQNDYIDETCDGMDYVVYEVNKEVISNLCKNIPIERPPFIYNYYFNVVMPYIDGWCMFLDDDDELCINPEFEKDKSKFYLFRVDIGNRIIPNNKNFGKIVLNDISGIGVIFHSSQFQEWKPQRGGDYDFIKSLSKKYEPIFKDEILTQTQKGNMGRRNDIKDKSISVNLATYPARLEQLKTVLENLSKISLIDVIRVYMNEYKSIPEGLPKDKVIYKFGKDLKDSGKFFWAMENKNEYYFTIDDDLIYPKEYFIRHLETLQKYDNEIFVSLHGKVMNEKPTAFNDCISNYHCLKEVKEDVWVNNPGTGVMAFDNSKFTISVNMFEYHGMADLWMAYYLQKNKIPCICRKHEANELTYILPPESDTLFEQRTNLHENHKKVLSKINKFALYGI
ncbi:hypothetical protein [Massilibacteroides sp.]|uniref:hypothetical protein n=1 Tax=Massilibacteroides sp. TaxID=2034766 RepID=UPI002604C206|nr:hypothetical protein [Massilibacteroides sp.]MDD4515660.1 hypothetical protein [Massilibacteroides sp.]